MEIKSGFELPLVTTLPSLASEPDHLYQLGNDLYHSGTYRWNQLLACPDALIPQMAIRGVIPRLYFFSNLLLGTMDIGTPPVGYKWMIRSSRIKNNTGASITIYPAVKFSGTYYRAFSTQAIPNNSTASINGSYLFPILENGDYLAINSTATGLTGWIYVDEFPASVEVKCVKLLSMSTGNNTLYTCPVGANAILPSSSGFTQSLGPSNVAVANQSGTSRTFYAGVIPTGQSLTDPATGSYSLAGIASTFATNAVGFLNVPCYVPSQASVVVNASGASAGLICWLNVYEYLIPT